MPAKQPQRSFPKRIVELFRFKKLDWLIVKSFIGPFVLTFFIAIFVLIMQFLWKYIDDLVGKGLSTWILLEFIFYASARLVPMALPLAVLLASIMTLGAFGEHMELTAMKSSGISLFRIFRPLIITVAFISIGAFLFSNYLLPVSNLKFNALYHDIRSQKPTMFLKEGIFYNEFENISLRIGHKGEDGALYDVMVYDHSSGKGNDHVITAQKGKLTEDEKGMAMTLTLYNGKDYKELPPKETNQQNGEQNDPVNNQQQQKRYEQTYTKFDIWAKKFDLSKFKLKRSDENYYKDVKQMLNLRELMGELDTLQSEKEKLKSTLPDFVKPYYILTKADTAIGIKANNDIKITAFKSTAELLSGLPKEEKKEIITRAETQANSVKTYLDVVIKQVESKHFVITDYLIEIYKKFTLSVACLVLFFVGAPLGSIIRKGGLGWPLFYSIIFFILYHVSTIIGEKMVEKHTLPIYIGMWMATIFLLPIGIFLSYKAANDSALFNADAYTRFFKRFKKS